MHHLQPFQSRKTFALPLVAQSGWRLKQYAIVAGRREFDEEVASAATLEAISRLPVVGKIEDDTANHGVGFQIIHFAEVAVVSPVFFWQWGSVLASIHQLRASWENPTHFDDGVQEVVGCVWEMDVVCFEVTAWKNTVLNDVGTPAERLDEYLRRHAHS